MANKLWIDPPSGWRYGFPKIWDPTAEPDIKVWLVQNGYPEPEVDFGLNYYRQWVAEPDSESKIPTLTEPLQDKLQDIHDVFQQWESDFANERSAFWNSLTPEQQLLAFCEVVSRLTEAELVDKRSYRGVLYDAFGFGPDSYVTAQVSGFLDLHNAIKRKS